MGSSLARTLDLLQSEGDLPPSALEALSDMDSTAAAEVRRAWQRLPAKRRQATIQQAGRMADDHIELNFDRLAFIGLDDPDPIVRRQAIANLWESEDSLLPGRFIECLETDVDPRVRAEAARALGRFVLDAEEEETAGGDRLRLEAALLAAASSADHALHLRAVEALGYSARPEVPGILQAAYDSQEEESRQSALLAMGRSGESRWRDLVLAELRNPSPGIRREAARAAGELELRRAVPDLIDLLDDVNPEIQIQSIWSLGQIGGRTAERALQRVRSSTTDDGLRTAIDDSLGNLTFLEGTRDLDASLRARRPPE